MLSLAIDNYLAIRRAVGFKLKVQEGFLHDFFGTRASSSTRARASAARRISKARKWACPSIR
jgi:hypothetical protein